MSADTIVRLIGLAMALTLVLANGRLRALPWRRQLALALVWIGLIVLAALLFRGFDR